MARAERITLQEASELSGVSIPTIYRRIRSGELRGAICIDASGKHWELFKSDLPKLTLKRKKRSTEVLPAIQYTAEVGEQVAENVVLKAESTAIDNTSALSAASEGNQTTAAASTVQVAREHELLVQNEVLKARCADLESRLKQLGDELDLAKDDAAYWRGRWEQIGINFEALRRMLEDKNSDDQNLISELRGQIADLQNENLEEKQAEVEESSLQDSEAESYFDSLQTVEEQPRVTKEMAYDFRVTQIDDSADSLPEIEQHEEIYPEPDFGNISSSSLTSADDINPVATNPLATHVAEPVETIVAEVVPENSGNKSTSLPTTKNSKSNMRHSKGRFGKRGRKRIPPLR